MELEPEREMEAQILVAGVGNAWLQDDGFGGAVVAEMERRGVPDGVTVMDFGTGGLDLAYEVMRGYHALVIVDVSQQGGEPGSLYVIEPDDPSVAEGVEDGAVIDPHGMDPATMLRFVRAVGGWPGRVLVVACEPAEVDDVTMALTPKVAAAVGAAADLVLDTIETLRADRELRAVL